ncbi:Uncharacterised protein [Cedecea neteri]|uniref:Uncharacterized protein n=1 Tax=Cedecea neteri TaxID=158822 RepID=A0A2X3JAP1_9ENTR|nr:Uncharacterised protein [Cedecea neteri]
MDYNLSKQSKIKYNEELLAESCIDNIDDVGTDERLTLEEYESLSHYQKFCIDNNLMLSDHSLYCNCYASSKDNIVIATTEKGVYGELYCTKWKMVLNRLKARVLACEKRCFLNIKLMVSFLTMIPRFVI